MHAGAKSQKKYLKAADRLVEAKKGIAKQRRLVMHLRPASPEWQTATKILRNFEQLVRLISRSQPDRKAITYLNPKARAAKDRQLYMSRRPHQQIAQGLGLREAANSNAPDLVGDQVVSAAIHAITELSSAAREIARLHARRALEIEGRERALLTRRMAKIREETAATAYRLRGICAAMDDGLQLRFQGALVELEPRLKQMSGSPTLGR